MENVVKMDNQAEMVTQDHLDNVENLVNKVQQDNLVLQEREDKMDLLDPQAHLVIFSLLKMHLFLFLF